MSDVHAAAGYLQVTFHDDDETPLEFVIELLHAVFKKPIADAMRFSEAVSKYGEAVCDAYPRDVANKLLEAAGSALVLAVIRFG
jgi:ATP-dependent Clp protease adapter protein ClpS